MIYEDELNQLNDNAYSKGYKTIKLLPNQTEQGFLAPQVKNEINKSLIRNQEPRSVEELRMGAGWRHAKDLTTKEITITNETIRGIRVRRYNRASPKKSKAILLFIHGGGFFSGSLDNVDLPCKTIVDKIDVQVLSIDYRLSPDNKFPSALIDCQTILDEIFQNHHLYGVNPQQIYVMGDSAGGNLSVVTAMIDKLLHCNYIAGQILVYPALSLELNESIVNWHNYTDKEDTGLLQPYFENINQSVHQIYQWYAGDYDLQNQLISPLNSPETFNFPRTLLICGEYDFLKFQCEKFVEKFSNSTDITYIEYSGMTHAFMDKIGDYPQAESLCNDVALFLEKGMES